VAYATARSPPERGWRSVGKPSGTVSAGWPRWLPQPAHALFPCQQPVSKPTLRRLAVHHGPGQHHDAHLRFSSAAAGPVRRRASRPIRSHGRGRKFDPCRAHTVSPGQSVEEPLPTPPAVLGGNGVVTNSTPMRGHTSWTSPPSPGGPGSASPPPASTWQNCAWPKSPPPPATAGTPTTASRTRTCWPSSARSSATSPPTA
jgi:hypothetical protein